MFKALHKVREDNKGFTISELLVTLAIMALVASLLCQLMGSIWKKYRMVENLYIIQTEVQAIASLFQADTRNGSLSTATNVDLLYEDLDALVETKTFQSCPELGSFVEDEETGDLTFNSRNDFTNNYLFVYKGYFYVLDDDKKVASRYKFTDEAKLDIKYEVSVNAFSKDADNKEKELSSAGAGHVYLPDGVTVTIASAPGYDFYYDLKTSFSLKNAITNSNQVNFNNGGMLTSQYVAGYTQGILPAYYENDVPKGSYPNVSDSTATNYAAESGVSYLNLQSSATVIRYMSSLHFNQSTPAGGNGSMNVGTGCSATVLMMNNKLGEGVKTTLRGFRDDVLKGNAVGEMIIDKYYNSWSPAIIELSEKSPIAKKAFTNIIITTAYIIEMAK